MKLITAIALGVTIAGTSVYAQNSPPKHVKARQGQFQIMAMNLGILGGMAQGKIEYNAEDAQAAADTLVAVSNIQQGPMWPEGSDNIELDMTRANPSIWDNAADFASKWAAFGEGAMVMQAAASNGQEALGPAMGAIGGTCKACHDNHRGPER